MSTNSLGSQPLVPGYIHSYGGLGSCTGETGQLERSPRGPQSLKYSLPCCGHSLPTPDLYQPYLNRDALSTVLKVPIVSVGICSLSFSVRCFRSTVRWHLLLEEDETASSQLFRRHFLAGSPGCSEGHNYNAVTSGDVTVSGDGSSACRELGKDFQRTHFSWSKKEEVRDSSVKRGEVYFRKSTTGMPWVGSNGWGGRAFGQASADCSLPRPGAGEVGLKEENMSSLAHAEFVV